MMMAVFEETAPSFNADTVASGLQSQSRLLQELLSAIETKDMDAPALVGRISEIEKNLKKLKRAV